MPPTETDTDGTPLITNASEARFVSEISEQEHEFEYAPYSWTIFKVEGAQLSKMAAPVSISYLLSFSLNVASVLSLGHVGTKELAASALTTMYCNVTGFSIGQGMASALDTLCSQAHTGSSDKTVLGKHLQRGIVLMLLLSIPISILWLFTEPILLLVGQDPEISRLSGIFSRWMIPGLFPFLVGDCLRRYLQGQEIMNASMYITLIASPINFFLQWFLVWSPYAIGIIGAPIATSITNVLVPLMLIIYVRFFNGSQGWGGWEWKEALDWKQILLQTELGIPGVAMLCSEWWAFEILALAAGLFGDAVLAAQTIVLQTCSLVYCLPLGLSIATATRTGNCLGANKPNLTRHVAITGILTAVLLAVVNSSILVIFKDKIGYIFTNDLEVVKLVGSVLPLGALFQLNDGIGAVGGGVLRGCGHQKFGAMFNLAGYYMFGIPIGVFLAFQSKMGLLGLWIGITIGLFFVSMSISIMIIRMDWREESRRALDLLNRHSSVDNLGDLEEANEQTSLLR
ncbi:mate-domain-containing protein [Gorgonomyces haynaldii]|nr:mate-domain-containing protein [Gorgonomyces haynaldii]